MLLCTMSYIHDVYHTYDEYISIFNYLFLYNCLRYFFYFVQVRYRSSVQIAGKTFYGPNTPPILQFQITHMILTWSHTHYVLDVTYCENSITQMVSVHPVICFHTKKLRKSAKDQSDGGKGSNNGW